MAEAGQRDKRSGDGKSKSSDTTLMLKDAAITRDQFSNPQQLAEVPEDASQEVQESTALCIFCWILRIGLAGFIIAGLIRVLT
jgi:hypothetical protein